MATAGAKLSPFFTRCLLQSIRFSSNSQNHGFPIYKKSDLTPTALIDLLSSDPDPISAANLFRWASRQRSFRHTPATYSHLASMLGLAGKSELMEGFLKEMARSHYPDAESSFQSLVESFCRNRRPMEALKVFEIASSVKFRLSISTCNELLGALVRERLSLDAVVFVYKEMVKAGILPNVDTLNCLIEGLVENGRMDLALDQFERMEKKDCRPNGRTFEIVIGGLCLSGRANEAVSIWNRMLEIGCGCDRDFYTGIVPWFCRVHRLDEAMKLFKLMKSDGFLPGFHLYSVLIHYLCENLRMKDAIAVFEEMGESTFTPTACIHVDIVNAYCKLGEFDKAMCFLEGNDALDTEIFNALLQGLCDGERVGEATSYLRKIQEMGVTDDHSWNILISCLCRKGNVGKAFEVLCRMIVSSSSPDDATYSSVVTGFCEASSYDGALDWFRQGLAKNMVFDSKSCSELIKGLCHMERVQEAVEIFCCVSSKCWAMDTDALDILIRGLCLRGNVNEAIRIRFIASCNGIPSTSFTYDIVLLSLFNLKKEKDVLPLLSQILAEGCTLNFRTFCILVCGLCAESTCWNAAHLFNRMVQSGFSPDTETLEKLVHSASKCSQLHLVVHSLDKVIEGGGLMSPTVCNMIIFGLLKEGHKNEARGFLDWMLGKGWVPNSHTHGLLIGSVDVEGRDVTDDECRDGDGVSSILSEGLGGSS